MTLEILPAVEPDLRAAAMSMLRRASGVAATGDPAASPAVDREAVAEAGEILLLATEGGVPAGAALAVLRSGGVAFVWPPASESAAPERLAGALLTELCRRLDVAGTSLAQCLLEPRRHSDAAILQRHGFTRLTEMVYLERLLPHNQSQPSETNLIEIKYESGANENRFSEVLEATYVETLDCPELNGWRRGHEVLAAHRGAGEFAPSLWTLYNDGQRDVGILLMADHPEMRAWEVVYVGIVPAARRRGHARRLLRAAFSSAFAAGREAVLLAVDVRNRWARTLYESMGFCELVRRDVYMRRGP